MSLGAESPHEPQPYRAVGEPSIAAEGRTRYDRSVIAPADIAPESIRPLRRTEYDRLVTLGVFGQERIELLHGMLVTMSPQGSPHAAVTRLLNKLLVPALGERALVQIQAPLAVSDHSEPEPDVAVLAPSADGYAAGHPETAFLVVEVAASSLTIDRQVKAALYAGAGVPEYWIVDVVGGQVEVYTGPEPEGYTRVTRHGRDQTLRLRAFPDVALPVADFLPASPDR